MMRLNAIASYYHKLGLSIYPFGEYDIFDSENKSIKEWDMDISNYDNLDSDIQTDKYISELFDGYYNYLAIGTIVGKRCVRAITVKDINSRYFDHFEEHVDPLDYIIRKVLNLLSLPNDYQWVIVNRAHSSFRIIFLADEVKDFNGTVLKCVPWQTIFDKVGNTCPSPFKEIHLLWSKYPIFLPSDNGLESEMLFYSFNNGFEENNFPIEPPMYVPTYSIDSLFNAFCIARSCSIRYAGNNQFYFVHAIRCNAEDRGIVSDLFGAKWDMIADTPEANVRLADRFYHPDESQCNYQNMLHFLDRASVSEHFIPLYNICSLLSTGYFEVTDNTFYKYFYRLLGLKNIEFKLSDHPVIDWPKDLKDKWEKNKPC